MHAHTERFGVRVSGVRNQAPCGPKADEQDVIGNAEAAVVLAARGFASIGGGAPIATEEEIHAARSEISDLERQAGEKHAEADAMVAQYRKDGVNIVADEEAMKRVDDAYMAGDELKQKATSKREGLDKLLARDSNDRNRRRPADDRPPTRQREERPSMGRRFTESDEYAKIKKLAALQDGSKFESDSVEVLERDEFVDALRLRATLDLGPMVESDRQFFPPIAIPVRVPRVLDLIFVGKTNSDTVEFVEETTRTDAAAETAYGTAVPEANYVYTRRSRSVQRVGHFVTVTEGNLEDEGQTETIIEGRLMSGVERRLETQAVQGDGIGNNLLGILNTSGIGTQALGADTRLDALHKAITVVRINLEGDIDAIGLHPTDYQAVALGKDSTGEYLLGDPANPTSRSIWGYPTAVTTAFPAGTPLVGNYKQGAVLWMRRGVSVKVTDAVNDDALKGLLKLIATARAAFAAWVPRSFCKVTGF